MKMKTLSIVVVACVTAVPWTLRALWGPRAEWLEDWDDGVNYVSNSIIVEGWAAGRAADWPRLVKALAVVWGRSGVVLGVWEPVAMTVKLLFVACAGAVSESPLTPSSPTPERLTLDPNSLSALAAALHVLAAVLLQVRTGCRHVSLK